jgi:hypothetical protein
MIGILLTLDQDYRAWRYQRRIATGTCHNLQPGIFSPWGGDSSGLKEIARRISNLSDYPAAKIVVACLKCRLRVQYDRAAMLATGGDRPLPDLLTSIARRHGCALVDRPSADIYVRCGAAYPELPDLLRKAGQL